MSLVTDGRPRRKHPVVRGHRNVFRTGGMSTSRPRPPMDLRAWEPTRRALTEHYFASLTRTSYACRRSTQIASRTTLRSPEHLATTAFPSRRKDTECHSGARRSFARSNSCRDSSMFRCAWNRQDKANVGASDDPPPWTRGHSQIQPAATPCCYSASFCGIPKEGVGQLMTALKSRNLCLLRRSKKAAVIVAETLIALIRQR